MDKHITNTLERALEALAEYHAYGQTMRRLGRGFDWGEYPGESTTAFIERARTLLDKEGV
jgi:hypothetical protein